MTTYCYPYKRGTGWRSQGFRSGKGSPYNAAGGHTGFDQAMPAGTPIYAPGDGIIRNSGWLTDNYMANPWWLTRMGGDTLVIDCTDSFRRSETMPTFIIAHLQESTAPFGAFVRKGQQIGVSGNSGTATTGAHAHIEALPPNWDVNNGVYGRVNPELYFTEWPEDVGLGLAAAGSTTTSTPTEEEIDMAAEARIMAQLDQMVTWEHERFKVLEGKANLTLQLVTAMDASLRFIKGPDSDTLYELEAGVLRGITKAEWLARGGLAPVVVDQGLIDDLMKAGEVVK